MPRAISWMLLPGVDAGGITRLCSGGRSGLLEVTVGAALRRADRNLLGTRAPCWKPIELWPATKVFATVKSSDET